MRNVGVRGLYDFNKINNIGVKFKKNAFLWKS